MKYVATFEHGKKQWVVQKVEFGSQPIVAWCQSETDAKKIAHNLTSTHGICPKCNEIVPFLTDGNRVALTYHSASCGINSEVGINLYEALATIIKRGYALDASDHALAIDALNAASFVREAIDDKPLPCGCRTSNITLCTHGNSPLA